MRGRGDWRAALLLLAAAATAREVVRLGYFTEAQPFEVACARGWFEGELDIEVVCLPQSAGVGAVSKIDDGDLELSLLGSTPAAAAIARRLAETRTQKHRRANLPRRTSAFSSRHDENV